jgi:DNA modification methylase
MKEERIGDCRLILGDCLEVMRSWPSCFRVPALVTDPPYGIGEASNANASRSCLAVSRDYGTASWDDHTADEAVAHAVSIARHSIVFGGNYYSLPPTSCWLIWDKQNGDNDFADCELAWTNLPKAVRRIYWRWHGMIRRGDDVRVHPTQKPVGVMTWCIEHLPETADTILDPFAGSGTTGVAAVRMGRKFIGIERDPEHFESMCRRIEDAHKQPADLFIAPPQPQPKQEALL